MTIASDWTTKQLFGTTLKIALLAVVFPELHPQTHDGPTPETCLCICDPTPEQLAAIQADHRFAIIPESP